MGTPAEASREFWRGVLVAEHKARVPGDLVAALRRLAEALAVPLRSVWLAAHAKVLAALSGEHEVSTGYVAPEGGQPLPCRLTTEPDSWRTLLLNTHRVESDLLAHGVKPPVVFGTTRPEKVARGVIRAITREAPEVLVTPYPLRPLLALAVLASRTAERLAERFGVTRTARSVACLQGRLDPECRAPGRLLPDHVETP